MADTYSRIGGSSPKAGGGTTDIVVTESFQRAPPTNAGTAKPANTNASVSVGGQLVNLTTNPQKAQILSGMRDVMRAQPSNIYPDKEATTAQVASSYLHMVGICTVPSKDATYSLLDDQSEKKACDVDETTVDNPNIFDKKAARDKEKSYPTAEDKFPS